VRILLASCRLKVNVFLHKQLFRNVMRDALCATKHRLAREIDSYSAVGCKPIPADPWVISSLLQKSIRRGETEIAQRAALTLFKLKGAAIWRRLMIIGFEDIGVGSIDALTMTVAAAGDSAWRKNHGVELKLAVYLTSTLAASPKDRSADYLCGAKDHPRLAGFTQAMTKASLNCRILQVRDEALDLPQRTVAALSTLSIGPRGEISRGTSGLDALLTTFRELGVPEELVAATGIAAARTREPITVMVPLIWLMAARSKKQVYDCAVPPLVEAGGVPLYALDKHTRLGREAIWRFACENESVRACLARFVPASQRRSGAYVAAFYVDAAPLARRLFWDQSEALETFGIERDLYHAGTPLDGICSLLEAMRANLKHLNELRAQVLARSQAGLPQQLGAP
jgi:hypothetical protein